MRDYEELVSVLRDLSEDTGLEPEEVEAALKQEVESDEPIHP